MVFSGQYGGRAEVAGVKAVLAISAAGLSVIFSLACRPATARTPLLVAAAADLSFAMGDIARGFEKLHPEMQVRPSFGSSGNFYAQIRNGAPYDVFLSADMEYPRSLARSGAGAQRPVFVYAVGRLVVWTPASSGIDPADALFEATPRRIAIANPRHAPNGRAAEAALRSLGVYDRTAPRLVMGDNVAQTLAFVQSGAADLGIVALSLALAPPARNGRYWRIPEDSYPPLEHGGLLLRNSAGAKAFREYLLSAAGRAILERDGYGAPPLR